MVMVTLFIFALFPKFDIVNINKYFIMNKQRKPPVPCSYEETEASSVSLIEKCKAIAIHHPDQLVHFGDAEITISQMITALQEDNELGKMLSVAYSNNHHLLDAVK